VDQSELKPEIDVYGLSDVGKVREVNEDGFLVARLSKKVESLYSSLGDAEGLSGHQDSQALLFVVADGVGGSDHGQLASRTAIESLGANIQEAAGCYFGHSVSEEDELLVKLEEAIERAHEKVIERRSGSGSAATTVTLVTLIWPRGYVLHVGDSRGYYLNSGRLRQFTRDQTMAEKLIDEGVIQEGDEVTKRFRNVLTRAVGSSDAKPVVGLVDFEPGDSLLLCSDGLTKHVDDETIQSVMLSDLSARGVCEDLLQRALEGGGRDNITILAARMGSP